MTSTEQGDMLEAFVTVLNFALDKFRTEIRAHQAQQTEDLKAHIDRAVAARPRRAATKVTKS